MTLFYGTAGYMHGSHGGGPRECGFGYSTERAPRVRSAEARARRAARRKAARMGVSVKELAGPGGGAR